MDKEINIPLTWEEIDEIVLALRLVNKAFKGNTKNKLEEKMNSYSMKAKEENMNKFKVGEEVWIKKDLNCGKEYGHMFFFPDMNKLKGKKTTIIEVENENYKLYGCSNWWFSDEMLEKVEVEEN